MSLSSPSGEKAVRSAVYIGTSQMIRAACIILSTVVLARILSPEEFGVIAMVSPVTAFVLMFQDFGLTQATVQARDHNDSDSTDLFFFSAIASIILSFIMVIFAPLVALFYNDVRTGYITAASGLSIITIGLGAQHVALLNRKMEFKNIALAEGLASVSMLVVSVVGAVIIKNYWSVFIGTLAGSVVQSFFYWTFEGWRPSGVPSLARVRAKIAFGANLTSSALLNFLIRNADNILIARMNGAYQVGLYDRAYKLMMFPLSSIAAPLGRVMLPVLSRQIDDPEKYRRSFFLSLHLFSLIIVPGIVVSAFMSDGLITLLLGREWKGAESIYFWLSLTGVVQVVTNPTGWLFVSSGRVREQVWWGLVSAPIVLIGFIVGAAWGGEGVAISLFITTLIRAPALFVYSTKGTSVRPLDLYRSLLEPLSSVIPLYLIDIYIDENIPFIWVLCLNLCAAYLFSFSICLATGVGVNTINVMRGHLIRPLVDFFVRIGRK